MKYNKLNLYFCPDCKSKYLEKDCVLVKCPKCNSNLVTNINTVKVVLDENK